MDLRVFDLPGLDDARFQCVDMEIGRHIRQGKYTNFWIKFKPPGSEETFNCSGEKKCCAAGYCFEYTKSGWFSFDMELEFPDKKKYPFDVVYNLGEMTNKGPWDYVSNEFRCWIPRSSS